MTVVALTTACAGEPAAAPAPSATTTTTTVPPTPAELDQRAKAAIAPPGAFDALKGVVQRNEPTSDGDPGKEGEIVTFVCDDVVRPDGVSVARTRIWSGGVTLYQKVHATADRPAAQLLSVLRRQVESCAAKRPADQVQADLPLAKPEGVEDLYGFCEANLQPDLVPWSCHAVLGRGTLITDVVASDKNKDAALLQLTSVVPIFAQSFAKA